MKRDRHEVAAPLGHQPRRGVQRRRVRHRDHAAGAGHPDRAGRSTRTSGTRCCDEWPAYLAYITSFLTVGSVWIAHHNLFSRLRFVDPVLLRLNLLLLLAAAFLPFPTGVLAAVVRCLRRRRAHRGRRLRRDRARHRAAAARRRPLRALAAGAHRRAAGRDAAGAGARERNWRDAVTAVSYGLAILAGVFVFPKLAAAAYLLGRDPRRAGHRGRRPPGPPRTAAGGQRHAGECG